MYGKKALLFHSEKRNPLSIPILDSIISRSLEKPFKLQSYDETRDPDEHIRYVDNRLDYYHIQRTVKWKFLASTLIEYTMTWFKTLINGIIDSWKDLCEAFNAKFTTWRRQPTIMELLNWFILVEESNLTLIHWSFTKVEVVAGEHRWWSEVLDIQ